MHNFIRLQENDKKRFIDIIYNKFHYQDMRNTTHPDCPLPTPNDLLGWLNTSASDKYKIDWNKVINRDFDEICRIFSSYYDYVEKGGSIKSRKFKDHDTPISIFERARLGDTHVNFAHTPEEVKKSTDLALLEETPDWLFVLVLTHRGAEWCNTFNCGGQGARWCIGYKQNKNYWDDYVKDGAWFILAFNKNTFQKRIYEKDTMKFMIEFHRDSSSPRKTRAWLQTDESEDVIPPCDWDIEFGTTYDILEELLCWYEDVVEDLNFDYATIGKTFQRW